MPNVLLTTGCNLSCQYCFAQEKMHGKRKDISFGDVRKVIAFLRRSNCPIFRVMGGEPTLHPQFIEIVQLALQEGMHVDVLSNGTWTDKCNDFFSRISPHRMLFLLNVDHPDSYTPRQWQRIENNLAAITGRKGVTLSFNIFEKQPRYAYIFDLTTRYDIRNIRMSFSLPVFGAQNTYLDIEEHKGMAPFIMQFVREAESHGVTAQLDNALPLCIFSYEQAGELMLKGVLDPRRNARCEPIIDIGPDLTVWFCFCLSKLYNRRLAEFENLQEIQAYYREVMHVYQDVIFPMEECYDCDYREVWGCQGGCITHSILKDKGRHLGEKWIEAEHWREDAAIALAEEVSIRRYEIPTDSFVLSEDRSGINVEVDGAFAPLWPLLDGQRTPRQVIDGFVAGDGDQGLLNPTDAFTRQVMKEGLEDLLLGFWRQGFLVQVPPLEVDPKSNNDRAP
jgi:radical SAM protein with 4Fe4S-binding SPASM domain